MNNFDFKGRINSESLKDFFVHCYREGVSDIHLNSGYPIVVSLHGRLIKASPFNIDLGVMTKLINEVWAFEIVSILKSGQGVDRALQLNGDEQNRYGLSRTEKVRFRCNFMASTAGKENESISITMRIINNNIPNITDLNIEEDLFHALLPHKGLGLICGETGSGKSTLMASIYQYCQLAYSDRKIVTYEDPIEYILTIKDSVMPVIQAQIGRDVPSFAEGLRLSLRQAPDVIGIGEMRDLETIEGAITNARSGHLCLSTMHTNSCGETIPRAVLMFPSEQRDSAAMDILNVTQYIIIQRLLKTLDGKRVAVREFIVFDDDIRFELAKFPYKEWSLFIDNYLKNKNARLSDKAWKLYEEGIIDKDEMISASSYKEFMRLSNGQ